MLPHTMQAIEMTTSGGPDVLKMAERALPSWGADEVLIKVAASGVNGPDIAQRKGLYPPPPGASDLIGLEVSGTIVAVGSQVTRWKEGDEVCALTNGGGYAEYVNAPAAQCLAIPENVSLVDAAGLPETYFTVWNNFFLDLEHTQGTLFLVHGGAGGIGSTAIQLGVSQGLRVFTTCSTDEKAGFCKQLGAERIINYNDEDFVEIVKSAGGAGLILDMLGGDYVDRNFAAAAPDGLIVQLAFNRGAKVTANLAPLMMKRLTLTGSTLRPRSAEFKARIASDLEAKIWPRLKAGEIKTVTHTTFPSDDVQSAHELMESSGHMGKILLTWA